jgi:hypothetical protein
MVDIIGSDSEVLNPSTYALKAWLSRSIFRLGLYPKALYMPLGIDQSTWSRWTSLEHEHTPPSGMLGPILALLDKQAAAELQQILAPTPTKSGGHFVMPHLKNKRPGATRA